MKYVIMKRKLKIVKNWKNHKSGKLKILKILKTLIPEKLKNLEKLKAQENLKY